MNRPLNLALVAHDRMKVSLMEWARYNAHSLSPHVLFATGTTGRKLQECGLVINCLKSGPLGGDAQLGAMIAEGKLDILFFFPDPLTSQPHDVDVKALTRLAEAYNLPMALNRSTADFIISSPLFGDYVRKVDDHTAYTGRKI